MKIRYKFNKSSEARDCVVESVELELIDTKEVELTEEQLFEIDSNFECKYEYTSNETVYDYDYEKGSVRGEYDFDFTQFAEKNQEDYVNRTILGHCTYYRNGHSNFEERDFRCWEEITTTETKQFISQQELKDYINTIQEPMEFIAEFDIDQVLMKEWIGEWETKQVLNQILGRDYTYWETVYVGSPKLNSNWIFKIK
jgi:hypothetical protein